MLDISWLVSSTREYSWWLLVLPLGSWVHSLNFLLFLWKVIHSCIWGDFSVWFLPEAFWESYKDLFSIFTVSFPFWSKLSVFLDISFFKKLCGLSVGSIEVHSIWKKPNPYIFWRWALLHFWLLLRRLIDKLLWLYEKFCCLIDRNYKAPSKSL